MQRTARHPLARDIAVIVTVEMAIVVAAAVTGLTVAGRDRPQLER
jgi:hypothetical protein